MTDNDKIEWSLLLMRLTIFLVMLMWTIDKFVNPGHAAAVYENFYFLGGLGTTVMTVLGAIELLVLAGFLLGLYRTWTYGAVLAFHSVSTFSSYKQYLAPFDGAHLLFFAAWPMWAACVTLFLLRSRDRRMCLGR